MNKTILYLVPHLSTGGMPQYLYKQIELLKDSFNIYCIEWSDVTGGVLVVQRNRIKSLLGNNLITLGANKKELFSFLNKIKPDVLHLQEIPEIFTIPYDIASELYSKQRPYIIIETSHDSSFDVNNKIFIPDRFLMVSQYQINDYKKLGVPCDLVEYPIEYKKKTKTREQALLELGLDPNKKHIINVGLFTPRKNQAEVIEYAKKLTNYPIQFHFIGNQADNFKSYWEPLMKNFPDNCKWWNERSDVDRFYEAADLFLFTSRGSNTDKETMPLVIRESISWQIPSLIYNLPVYLNYFNQYKHINYLDFDSIDNNCDKILELLKLDKNKRDLLTVIIPCYNHEKYIEKSINSVLSQKTNFEFKILVSDDCSKDNTFNIIQKYKNIPNVIIQKTKENEGTGPNRISKLVNQVKSDYITFLDGDDYYLDDYKLQKQIEFLENNHEYSIHSTAAYQIELNHDSEDLPDYYHWSLMEETTLKDNLDLNYIGFGFMLRNSCIRDKKLPDWFFDKDIFDCYWAIINVFLQYGKAKNERKWIGGVYRITPGGAFGERSESWKEEQISKQSKVLHENFDKKEQFSIIRNFNFNLDSIYDSHFRVKYKNVEYLKCPFDYVLYQMVITKVKPDLIIEIGTLKGGGAYYCADLLNSIGKGIVHTIDIENQVDDYNVLNHPRIKFFTDGYQNYDIELTKEFKNILVIDDASHKYQDVINTLNKFSKVVSKDSYFIVEDGVLTFLGGEDSENQGGPIRAIDEFLQGNDQFIIDREYCDFFGLNATFNPNGYLKRIK